MNTQLGFVIQQNHLTDEQTENLAEKRAAHLKSPRNTKAKFVPNQPVWYTDDSSDTWKAGFIESFDTHPDSYWIVNENNSRRFRRNHKDISSRETVFRQQRPEPPRYEAEKVTNPVTQPDQTPSDPPTAVPAVPEAPEAPEVPRNPPAAAEEPRRSSRPAKPNRDPNFIYQ